MVDEAIDAALIVAKAFEKLDVPYALGGSVASSMRGEIRSTRDVDIVCQLRASRVHSLRAALEPAFFVDERAIVDAVRALRSFNLVHRKTFMKVDVFVRTDVGIDGNQIRRGERVQVGASPADTIVVSSAEDIVLQKLIWYEKSDRVSERQWRDVAGVLKANRDSLDLAYLRRWAHETGVAESLERALTEAGIAR